MGNSTSQAQCQLFRDLWDIVSAGQSSNGSSSNGSSSNDPGMILDPIFKNIGLADIFEYKQYSNLELHFRGASYNNLGHAILITATRTPGGPSINEKQLLTVSYRAPTIVKHGKTVTSSFVCVSNHCCTTLPAVTRAIQGILTKHKAVLQEAAEGIRANALACVASADILVQAMQRLP